MNTRHLLLVGSLLATLSPAKAITPSDYRNELRQLATTYETAINTGDLAPLASLFDTDTTGVTVDNQSFRTFAELKAIYTRFHADFPGVVYRIKLDPTPSLLTADLAIAHGTAEEFVKTKAGEFSYISNWTAVLRRTEAGWKLVRSQVTMDPFRNSVVTFLAQKAKFTYGLIGISVGLIVGFLLGRVVRKRIPAA
jgi:ketosteroid isomerase-like protein